MDRIPFSENKTLFKESMLGNWNRVIEICTENPSALGAKITRAEDTVLHVAVSEATVEVVEKLINLAQDMTEGGLDQVNESGNTPLHLAAGLGLVEVCALLGKKTPSLVVKARNDKGETPLFMAAYHGKKKAFFELIDLIDLIAEKPEDTAYCRRNDGDTILHCAVYGEYFDLAFEIIHLYPNLINFNNEKGQTALHLLANKPLVFRSGHRIRRLDNLIYACIIVDRLKTKYTAGKGKAYSNGEQSQGSKTMLPENYQACTDAFALLTLVFKSTVFGFHGWSAIVSSIRGWSRSFSIERDKKNDEEHGQRRNQANHDESKKQEAHYDTLDEERGQHRNQANHDKSRKQEKHSDALDEERGQQGNQANHDESRKQEKHSDTLAESQFPENYTTCFNSFKIAMKILLVVLGIGIRRIEKIKRKKQKHTHACQLMDELVTRASDWEYDDGKKPYKDNGKNGPLPDFPLPDFARTPSAEDEFQPPPFDAPKEKDKAANEPEPDIRRIEKKIDELTRACQLKDKDKATDEPEADTPVLLAAKRGITEMVRKILETFPVAIQDLNSNHKNIVLLAVEHRQPYVYALMLERKKMKESVFGLVDKDGNSALHLAATLGQSRPWIIPGAALQMQWEIKWYKFVKNSMEPSFFSQYNKMGQTAREIFTQKHENLVKDGGKWLTKTSQSCSVVAALIATVAFASATTVPGGVTQTGFPTLAGQPAFDVFAIAALVALCFSVTSLIMFLSILTSRYQEMDFERDLPTKLILGLTTLFMSIAAMLVSFCAGHFYDIEDKFKYAAFPIYAITCLPVTFFAVAQFPLYLDLLKAMIVKIPERTYKTPTF